jgi:hypothetical protein
MYYICKFTDTWTLYDKENKSSRVLERQEIFCLRSLIARLLNSSSMLLAIEVAPININKLANIEADGTDTNYYITRNANIWIIYDGVKDFARLLEDQEISFISGILSRAGTDKSPYLAIRMSPINPNKLVNLPTVEPQEKREPVVMRQSAAA